MITQTPWFERKFDFNFPVGLFPVILERLRGTVFRIEGMAKGKPAMPDFRDALRTQHVCDAVLQSAKEQKWVTVREV